MLLGVRVRQRYQGLIKRFPDRRLVQFAARQDNDDVACWDLDRGTSRVVVIHDFATPGWEALAEFPDFHDWLRQAIEDLIEFE